MLAGREGRAVQRAIEIVVALARIYGARSLVPVSSVQVAGVSYKNLGEAGLEFLCEWADQGAKVRVPTTLNPAGLDLEQWKALGFSQQFYERQHRVIEAYTAMGITPTCTCTPYWAGNLPSFGQHIAWAESSAVSLANSVLGARSNREGGPSALAAAICGRTAAYGLHLDANRLPTVHIDVYCPLKTVSDWSALGYLAGRHAQDGVPCFHLHGDQTLCARAGGLLDDPSLTDRLKSLGAAMAASGAVALYHIAGLTPEAVDSGPLCGKSSGLPQRIAIRDLVPGYEALSSDSPDIDLVSIGCPHASEHELDQVARLVEGKRLRAALWVTTARKTRAEMPSQVETIEAAGGRVVSDTCLVVAPVRELGFRSMATNSAKMALYTPSHSGLSVRFGTLEQCVQAAVSARWS
jgi:predicted aconitase